MCVCVCVCMYVCMEARADIVLILVCLTIFSVCETKQGRAFSRKPYSVRVPFFLLPPPLSLSLSLWSEREENLRKEGEKK